MSKDFRNNKKNVVKSVQDLVSIPARNGWGTQGICTREMTI